MKYKLGDRVKIQSLNWYNKNKDKYGAIPCGFFTFYADRRKYCGKVFTICAVLNNCYLVKEDTEDYGWTDEMIEGLAEEEALKQYEIPTGSIKIWDLPNGYIFKDENGNVINAQKIVLEKKKEYPKTYEECCEVLRIGVLGHYALGYKSHALSIFQNIIICRDAYWEIAGEEMGLGKPWKPDHSGDFEHGSPIKYVIYNDGTRIVKERKSNPNHPLSFPIEEMRDAFYEAFQKEIEICKEFL